MPNKFHSVKAEHLFEKQAKRGFGVLWKGILKGFNKATPKIVKEVLPPAAVIGTTALVTKKLMPDATVEDTSAPTEVGTVDGQGQVIPSDPFGTDTDSTFTPFEATPAPARFNFNEEAGPTGEGNIQSEYERKKEEARKKRALKKTGEALPQSLLKIASAFIKKAQDGEQEVTYMGPL
tara:strand:+ start:894 stop:1427 length:534 start_codon:yes stop_codon:yes gene_type:complete